MVVHCFAGISRSTAAAFITLCVARPKRDERDIARRLRQASRFATPNARIIAIADTMLGRNGRMIEAIAEIGRGEMATGEHSVRARARGALMNTRPAADRDRAERGDRCGRRPTASDPRRQRRRAALRSVRSAGAPHFRDGAAGLGRRADGAEARLRRAALHLRRPRAARGGRRRRPASCLGRLPRADAHRRRAVRGSGAGRSELAAVVRFLSMGGLARRPSCRSSTRRSCRRLPAGRKPEPGEKIRPSRLAGASAFGLAFGEGRRCAGTKSARSTATSCSTRRASSRRPAATDATR